MDIKSLPKISLHDHLDGGLRPSTIVELSAEVGHKLPTTDAAELGNWFTESANSGSLVRYLETFDHTVAVMQTREGLERVAYEAVIDLAEQNVIYAELRMQFDACAKLDSILFTLASGAQAPRRHTNI